MSNSHYLQEFPELYICVMGDEWLVLSLNICAEMPDTVTSQTDTNYIFIMRNQSGGEEISDALT